MLHDPTFYVAISFILFLIFIGRPVVKMIIGTLDKRADSIGVQIAQATQEKKEAQQDLETTQLQESKILDQIQAIKSQANQDAEILKAESQQKIDSLIKREKCLAQERISRSKNQAVADIKREAVDLAILTTHKILESSIDEKANDKLVSQVLNEIEQMSLIPKSKAS